MKSVILSAVELGGLALVAIGLWWWWPAASLVFVGSVLAATAVAIRLGATERKE